MSYAIIGFGKIGQALAKAFARKGIEVSVATTRDPETFASAAAAIGPKVIPKTLADAVKADAAQLLAAVNAHDATKVVSHDAADVVQMAHGYPNVVGQAADLAANQKGFAADSTQKVTVADESVDVAASGDAERYKKSYYPEELGGKLYLAGDGSVRDKDTGYFTIMGRIDDVLNVSGHRLGTMEIESALVANSMVAEAAVVGRPDELTGEAVCAFVVLKQARPMGADAEKLAKQLRDWVAKEIGPIAKPKDIRFGDNLPKTRSGKIMRRLLRSIAKNETITQDISTLENPAILEQLKQAL